MGTYGNSEKSLPLNQKEMIVSPQEAEDIQIRQSTLRRHEDMGACGTSLKDMET